MTSAVRQEAGRSCYQIVIKAAPVVRTSKLQSQDLSSLDQLPVEFWT